MTLNSEVGGVIKDDSNVTPESMEWIVPPPAPTSLVITDLGYSFGPRCLGAPQIETTTISSPWTA